MTAIATHDHEALNLRPHVTGLMDRAQAAKFLTSFGYRIARATLAKYAVTDEGPPFSKFGRRPLYLACELLSWADSRLGPVVRSPSEAAAA
jgi:hypothetical protein